MPAVTSQDTELQDILFDTFLNLDSGMLEEIFRTDLEKDNVKDILPSPSPKVPTFGFDCCRDETDQSLEFGFFGDESNLGLISDRTFTDVPDPPPRLNLDHEESVLMSEHCLGKDVVIAEFPLTQNQFVGFSQNTFFQSFPDQIMNEHDPDMTVLSDSHNVTTENTVPIKSTPIPSVLQGDYTTMNNTFPPNHVRNTSQITGHDDDPRGDNAQKVSCDTAAVDKLHPEVKKAVEQSKVLGNMSPLIKLQLKTKLQLKRLKRGKKEWSPSFKEQSSGELTPEEIIKREMRLERNRKSANKSRENRQLYVQNLQKKIQHYESSNDNIREEKRKLQAEKDAIMKLLSRHTRSYDFTDVHYDHRDQTSLRDALADFLASREEG